MDSSEREPKEREPKDMEEQATVFLRDSLERLAAYRDHKETMAYAGFTLYAAAVVAALTTTTWPLAWGTRGRELSLALVIGLWLFVLTFLKWQLHRRRWAALRVAGIERLLAKWITTPPLVEELRVNGANPCRSENLRSNAPGLLVLLGDLFWPLKSAVPVVNPKGQVYPPSLVCIWVDQANHGSEAIQHERLLTIAGWLLFALLILWTLKTGTASPDTPRYTAPTESTASNSKPEPPPPTIERFTGPMGPFEPGISYNGADLYDRPAETAETCTQLCANDDRCRAVTFIISQKRCWVKNRVNPSAQSPDMDLSKKTALGSRSAHLNLSGSGRTPSRGTYDHHFLTEWQKE